MPEMAQFRLQQRQLALAEFKSLYKQRHFYEHRVKLLQHHRRVKKVSNNDQLQHKLWENGNEAQPTEHNEVEPCDMGWSEGSDSQIKTKANHDMEYIEHHEGSGGPQMWPEKMQEEGGDSMPGMPADDGGGDNPVPSMPTEENGGSEQGYPTGPGDSGTDMPEHELPITPQTDAADDAMPTTHTVDIDTADNSVPDASGTDSDMAGEGLRPQFADPWRRR
jgi:hypothetical protein